MLHILLAEDDEIDREAFKRAVRSLEAAIDEAANGAEALRLCRTNKYDCIILDHMLPDSDSIQLIPEMRGCAPSTPIIVVTGYGNELLAVKMIKTGAIDYLPKDSITEEVMTKSILEAVRSRTLLPPVEHEIDTLKEISSAATQRAKEINHEIKQIKTGINDTDHRANVEDARVNELNRKANETNKQANETNRLSNVANAEQADIIDRAANQADRKANQADRDANLLDRQASQATRNALFSLADDVARVNDSQQP
jgi:CheY-like chemotaxis protein